MNEVEYYRMCELAESGPCFALPSYNADLDTITCDQCGAVWHGADHWHRIRMDSVDTVYIVELLSRLQVCGHTEDTSVTEDGLPITPDQARYGVYVDGGNFTDDVGHAVTEGYACYLADFFQGENDPGNNVFFGVTGKDSAGEWATSIYETINPDFDAE